MMTGGAGASPFQSGGVGLHSNADSVLSLAIVECQLSMMLYITGAVIGSDKSLLPLHPATSYAGLYPFPGAEKITYKGGWGARRCMSHGTDSAWTGRYLSIHATDSHVCSAPLPVLPPIRLAQTIWS
jgi:hypothetical protein